jgi:hypothetical protein
VFTSIEIKFSIHVFFPHDTLKVCKENLPVSQVPVPYACNPSYLEDWGWECLSSRPAQANSFWDLISKTTRTKMDWRCGTSGRAPALQMGSPEFKLQSHQTKRKRKASKAPCELSYSTSWVPERKQMRKKQDWLCT